MNSEFMEGIVLPDMEGIPEGSTFYPVERFSQKQLQVIFGSTPPTDGYIMITPGNRGKLLQRIVSHFVEENVAKEKTVV